MGAEITKVPVNGTELTHYSFGSGSQPFVLIPGLSLKPVSLSANAVASSFKSIGEQFSCHGFDLRPNMPRGFTIADMADDLAAAMGALGLEGACVFGTSLGGMIAQELTLRHPHLVKRLVLASTEARPNAVSSQVIQEWIGKAESGDVRSLNRALAAKIYSPAFLERFGKLLAAVEDDGTPEEVEQVVVAAHAALALDTFDRLENISCPTLVIGSRCDQVLTGEASEEIAAKIGCELYMYDGYSHAVYDEAPDYKGRLLEFMTR